MLMKKFLDILQIILHAILCVLLTVKLVKDFSAEKSEKVTDYDDS